MKKEYIAPELEIRTFRLTGDILETSREIQGEIGGGELPTTGSTLPVLDGDGGDL